METALIIGAVALAAWFIFGQGAGYNPNAAPGSQSIQGNLLQAQQASAGIASNIQQQSMAAQSQTFGTLLSTGASVGGGLATAGIVGFTTTAGIAAAATAGVAALAGVALVLWQQHEQRMKDATNENEAWNIIYPDWASSIQQIFASYNGGQLDAPTAAAEIGALKALVFQDAVKFQGMPGIDWTGGNTGPGGTAIGLTNSQRIWPVACNSSCTIGCCLFNGVVGPQSERARAMLLGQAVMFFPSAGQFPLVSGATQFTVGAQAANPKYQFNAQPAFTLAKMR